MSTASQVPPEGGNPSVGSVSGKEQPTGLWMTAVNLFVSPAEAFRTMNVRPGILFPLVITLTAMSLVYVWYFQVVDYAWFVDDTLARSGGNMSEEQLRAVREFYANQSLVTVAASSVAGGVVMILLMYVLQAGYLTLVSLLRGDSYRFRHWFSLISWTGLPSLLVVLVMAVNILLSDNGQISISDANSLSLASLGMQSGGNAMLQGILDSISLAMIWSIALAVMGYRQWLQVGYPKAFAIITAPYLLLFGAMSYIALA